MVLSTVSSQDLLEVSAQAIYQRLADNIQQVVKG